MNNFRLGVLFLAIGLSSLTPAADLGGLLGLGETEPCTAIFADDNADSVVDSADVATSINRPVVGVVEFAFQPLYRTAALGLSFSATFDPDLPTSATQTVLLPPTPCFASPEPASLLRPLPPTTMDVGDTGTLTLGVNEYPLVVDRLGAGTWVIQGATTTFESSATFRFAGGTQIPPLEFSFQTFPGVSPRNPELRPGPLEVNYWRFDLPMSLDFAAGAESGTWVELTFDRLSSDRLQESRIRSIVPSTGMVTIPTSVTSWLDNQPNLVQMSLATVREKILPITLRDGTLASILLRERSLFVAGYNLDPIIFPVVNAISLNGGASSTSRPDVALLFSSLCPILEYQVSLSPDFADAEWIASYPFGNYRPDSVNQTVTIPATAGEHTVYVRLRNERGVSEPASATIRYEAPTAPERTSFALD